MFTGDGIYKYIYNLDIQTILMNNKYFYIEAFFFSAIILLHLSLLLESRLVASTIEMTVTFW